MADNENENILHIGFDDTDSIRGKCTTHFAFEIVNYLKNSNIEFLDYPTLIRLNPNIPWKTRGNGSVCLRIKINDKKNKNKIIEYIVSQLEKKSDIENGANPGLVILEGLLVPNIIRKFTNNAMFDILTRSKTINIAKKIQNIKYFTFGNGQGIVGAMASIGGLIDKSDYTFEIIAYRKSENCNKQRIVDVDKVIKINKDTFPKTFNNYDEINKRVLITPHGPDPVFCGIRGENPDIVVKSLEELDIKEKLEGYMIYRSNQGTNTHLQNELKLSSLKSYMAGYVYGNIVTKPNTIQGGHVLFSLQDRSKSTAMVAVYEPTGLTRIASKLEQGDKIKIGVGVRKASNEYPKVLNVEYIDILNLKSCYNIINPDCKKCGKRMKSEGKNKGYQCKKCGFRDKNEQKILIEKKRELKENLYIPVAKANRHLTKPKHRYKLGEKIAWSLNRKNKLHPKWFKILY
ncbi:MAG: TiaS agmantine-binding domain-containing protein [Nitrososphaeraceae archaeon]